MIDRYAVIGQMPCVGCGKAVVWERIGGRWFLNELTADTLRPHACKPRCLSAMRGGERCHRNQGHLGVHSSRTTLARRAEWARAA